MTRNKESAATSWAKAQWIERRLMWVLILTTLAFVALKFLASEVIAG